MLMYDQDGTAILDVVLRDADALEALEDFQLSNAIWNHKDAE